MADMVNHPAHYTDGKIEVIEYIEDKKLGYCLGNAIKYISRAGKKDKSKEIEDLKKAAWYIARRIKELEEGEGKMEYIPNWQDKSLTCVFCGKTASVKYEIYFNGEKVCVCNKCAFLRNRTIEKGGVEE